MPQPDYLRKYLNVYWLRPETALWRAMDCKAMHGLKFEEPSLDLSCADGVFSYVFAGGDFDNSFDVYKGTAAYEDFFDGADIYNAAPEEYDPSIAERPNRSFTVGTDWKENLLKKLKSWISTTNSSSMITTSHFHSGMTHSELFSATVPIGLTIWISTFVRFGVCSIQRAKRYQS